MAVSHFFPSILPPAHELWSREATTALVTLESATGGPRTHQANHRTNQYKAHNI